MMYPTNSPGARVDPYSPGCNNQLQLVENTGYQNYQLGGQQFVLQQFPQYDCIPVSPANAPHSPPHLTNLSLSPAMPAQAAAVVNPFELFAAPASPTQPGNAPVYSFGAAPVTPTQAFPAASKQSPAASLPEDEDFWSLMGFGKIDHQSVNSSGSVTSSSDRSSGGRVNPYSLDERGLPLGGTYYKVRITTPLLGAIFSSAAEVRNTLYKTATFQFVECMKKRPVVSFRIDGSAAETSGVGIGDVLINVNNEEIPNTDAAVKALANAPRPMTLEFYSPGKRQVRVVKTEGQCMVKYDCRDTSHPRTAAEWKSKFVVIGDLLGKDNVVYMYRSKAEYDIAVKEAQASPRTLSVKVKQFDITGARILKRGTVQYPNQPEWHYFVIMREFGLPIKISAKSEEELDPVYEGISGYLAKNRKTKGPSL